MGPAARTVPDPGRFGDSGRHLPAAAPGERRQRRTKPATHGLRAPGGAPGGRAGPSPGSANKEPAPSGWTAAGPARGSCGAEAALGSDSPGRAPRGAHGGTGLRRGPGRAGPVRRGQGALQARGGRRVGATWSTCSSEQGKEGNAALLGTPPASPLALIKELSAQVGNQGRYFLLRGVRASERRCLCRIYCSDSGENVAFGIVSVCHGERRLFTWLSNHWNCAVISGPFSHYPCLSLEGG